MGLIGESGAGKSTIGIAAMGYTRPGCGSSAATSPTASICRRVGGKLRQLRGARIAYVAQSAAAFNPAHRLLRNVRNAGHPQRDGRGQRGRQWPRDIRQVGLTGQFRRALSAQVSGGQLQRAMVAMAMSCQPDLIVFDGPTTALDVTTQIEVLAAIKEAIRLYNSAAIYISHDLAVVAQIADRVMVCAMAGRSKAAPPVR